MVTCWKIRWYTGKNVTISIRTYHVVWEDKMVHGKQWWYMGEIDGAHGGN